jgi:hypothetical protein
VLGSGKRLFPETDEATSFTLAEAEQAGDGIMGVLCTPERPQQGC